MKKVIFTCLMLALPNAFAESGVVPLDIEKGYWESNTKLLFNKDMNDMIASLPEAQRAAMSSMIESKSVIPMAKTCITDDAYNDFDEQFKEALGDEDGCKMTLKESTGQSFVGEYQCDNVSAVFSIEVESSKRHITNVVTSTEGVVQSKIEVIAEWKSADCPADSIQ